MFTKRLALIAVCLIVGACSASASVPAMINYQGKLMQPSGVPVPDGTYSMTFAIYSQPTSGTALWAETNSSVQVKGGLFSVLLGSVNNLPGNIFDNENRWFGVKVGTDPEMNPRQQLASVAYAQTAGSVSDASVTTAKLAPAAVTADKLAPGVAIPGGTIVMWSGAVADVPLGWKLCDGTSGTPDLRNRFIVGAGNEYAVAATGGEKFHQLTVAEMPSHTHVQNPHTHAQNPHYHSWPGSYVLGGGVGDGSANLTVGGGGYFQVDTSHYVATATNQNTTATNQNTGSDQPHENRPPYYALCFIMKLAYQ